MIIDCLIIGQGICGTFLAHELEKAGLSFIVTDDPNRSGASSIAAGIINPITGRRLVRTWMIEELYPFALHAYKEIGDALGMDLITQTKLIDFFPSAQMRLAFCDRHQESTAELSLPEDENKWRSIFNYDLGFGEISPCALVNLNLLLSEYRTKLQNAGILLEEKTSAHLLDLQRDYIRYKDIKAKKVIFCDGIDGVNNPYFSKLPFAPNKGEALIIEVDGLPNNYIFKKGMSLVPWINNLFWVGSSYEWQFNDLNPTAAFRERTRLLLEQWLRLPYSIVDHFAAIRPATLERRPFVGFHPEHSQIGILNGMGTKGCSLAPYFAKQLSANMQEGTPILEEASISRYKRILGKFIA
jgi:glycine/D-amino acid oxidase-like deaminating enzyme